MTNRNRKKSRRWFIGAGVAGAIATASWLRFRPQPYHPEIDVEPGKRVLEKYPSVDVHSHPGRSFLANGEFDSLLISSMDSGFESARVMDMRQGNLTASLFSLVADVQVLGVSSTGINVERKFKPGEAYADFERQLEHFESLVAADVVTCALSADDIRTAHQQGDSVAVLSCEGAGFVEDKLERLERGYRAGMRAVTPIHYRPSEYGDNQTGAATHGGLTALGVELVGELNRLGMVVDMAHASYSTVRDVIETTDVPFMLSHSHLVRGDAPNARLITPEHARLVADHGGIIGSWPAGITSETMSDFVDETLRLIDAVGVDHVSFGTDLDANYKPVLTDYVQVPEYAAMLLARGLSDEEVGKVLGTNFLRVFDAVRNARKA